MCHSMLMTRTRKPVNLTPDPEVLARLDAWIKAQDAPWTRAAVFDRAITEWLDRRAAQDE